MPEWGKMETSTDVTNQGQSFLFMTVTDEWLIITAASITLFSLLQAWGATLIIYGNSAVLKRIFPATQNLIRSHIDYLMMASLLGLVFFSCAHLDIVLPAWLTVTLCIGAIYNPFGFVLKAMYPQIGHSGTIGTKIFVMTGFLPATVGYGYSMILILQAILSR